MESPFSARVAAPIVTRTELPGDAADAQSRYIEAAVSGVLVVSFGSRAHLGCRTARLPKSYAGATPRSATETAHLQLCER